MRKTPAFWYGLPSAPSYALEPVSMVYQAGGTLHRVAARPYRAPQPVICIGNLVVGGAGKTPVALATARMLQEMGQRPAFVSRGYGGSAQGPLLVDPGKHSAAEVGDEPLLLAQAAPTWISKNKAKGVSIAAEDATQVILDDGLQNPTVYHDLAFLVVDGMRGLGNGRVLPAGPLRESLRAALSRIQAAVIVGPDRHATAEQFSHAVPVLTARLEPALPEGFNKAGNFVAFSGIGNPDKFFTTCRDVGLHLSAAYEFPDHHPYSAGDWQQLAEVAQRHSARLVTTAKDAVRLMPEWRAQVNVVPVELVFDNGPQMLHLLHRSIRN
ncbi:MAG: tetraacyldisaccharide 4'-kinase [Alphaproteobacteria bacterium]|nr:tetraacyldisaccharide 4'-kinase [Alphaproteobacteria bacterium]